MKDHVSRDELIELQRRIAHSLHVYLTLIETIADGKPLGQFDSQIEDAAAAHDAIAGMIFPEYVQ